MTPAQRAVVGGLDLTKAGAEEAEVRCAGKPSDDHLGPGFDLRDGGADLRDLAFVHDVQRQRWIGLRTPPRRAEAAKQLAGETPEGPSGPNVLHGHPCG